MCPHIAKALKRHAKVLHLKIASFQNNSITVQTTNDSIACGSILGNHPGDFLHAFDITEANSQNDFELKHNLRVRARRIILKQICHTRFGAEGCEDIDLEAYSHKAYKKNTDNLSMEINPWSGCGICRYMNS